MINYGNQSVGKEEISVLKKVLKSNNLTQGPYIELFEKKLCSFFGSKFCVSFSSGTSALYSLGKALGWSKKDYIITTPTSFLATSNCIEFCNANTEFVDINRDCPTINVNEIKKRFFELKKKQKKVAAIIAVDYSGIPCDWKELKKFSRKYKVKLINDNCHAMGTKYYGDMKYAIKYADYVVQSFHPVKTITTGEGGAVLTNDKKVNKSLKLFRNHCIIKSKTKFWDYNIKQIGFNFRLTDLQCAIGITQIKKIQQFLKLRRKISKLYNKLLSSNKNLILPRVDKTFTSAHHLYPIQIKKLTYKKKQQMFNFFKKKGFQLQVHYKPIILQEYYKKKYKLNPNLYRNAINFYKLSFSAPIYPGLKKKNIRTFSKLLIEYCEQS
ncbi:DegT/DnrJ/EryC1/StrS family aminotransferase [Pelagibacterales bacterium SAG-MED18]|nr:DegT/DnrJ/EryC1/StrS family aminotransferase [Pelagibacterales bacterium SAG-MED18]